MPKQARLDDIKLSRYGKNIINENVLLWKQIDDSRERASAEAGESARRFPTREGV